MNEVVERCGNCDKPMSLELLVWDGYLLPMKTWVCKSEGCFDCCILAENEPNIFDAIKREQEFQLAKWGNKQLSLGDYLLIIEGELEEAKQAWRKSKGNDDCLRELLQVATVCIRALESHGIVEREELL